jgi:hypothetical protein
MKHTNPATNGNSSIINPKLESIPRRLRFPGFLAYVSATAGSDTFFMRTVTISGIEPIVFAPSNIENNINKYLQRLFLPIKEDSRWFIISKKV